MALVAAEAIVLLPVHRVILTAIEWIIRPLHPRQCSAALADASRVAG